MPGAGFLSTILDRTGERVKERIAQSMEMDKEQRQVQTQALLDSIHAVDENGQPKLSPAEAEEAWNRVEQLHKSNKGVMDIIGKARDLTNKVRGAFGGQPNGAMLQRQGQQTGAAIQGAQQTQQPQQNQPMSEAIPGGGTSTNPTLPYTPPPPGRQLPPVQATANAAAESTSTQPDTTQPQPTDQQTGPQTGPTPPPKRTSMAQIIAAGSPAAQTIAENKAASKTQVGAAKELGTFETSQVGPRVTAEQKAKLQATYGDPQVVDAMIRMKRLEMPAIAVKPGEQLAVPSQDADGNTIYKMQGSAVPRIKPPEENLQDAAVLSTLKKHGQSNLWDSMDPNYPFIQQLPKEMQAEAAQEYERIKKTPDPGLESMRISMEGLRQVEMARIRQQMEQFEETQGPQAMENYRRIVLDNPNAMSEVPVAVRGRVINYMKSKGDRVPRILPSQMQETDFNADQTLARIQRVRDIIKQYPDLIGPVANAVGKGQEISGLALQDPEKAAAAADLRGSLTFLQTAEAKALLGSRPAFSWAEKFNDVTAHQKDQAPIMEGALKMQEAHAKMIKNGIDQQRYGTQKESTGGPTPPPTRQSNPTGYGPVESVILNGKTVQARKNLQTGKYRIEQ